MGMYIVRIKNGTIIEHRGEEHGIRLMQQLGVMPQE